MDSRKAVFRFLNISVSVLIIVVVILGIYKLGHFAYSFGYRVFTEDSVDVAPGKDRVVLISGDMSGSDIGEVLEDKGLINDSKLFLAQLKLSAYSDDLKPGTYTLNTSMTTREMIAIMGAGVEDTEEP